MLKITIPGQEFWDEKNERFVESRETVLQLEHSLISLSKWESKWHKPFLSKADKTPEETLDYIRCMVVSPSNFDESVLQYIPQGVVNQIVNYIDDKMTATWFNEHPGSRGTRTREVVTSELIYYWMIALNIPFECQKWHLNRLLTLIRVCSEKNNPPKKMSRKELAQRNALLNAQRRKALNTSG